MIIPLELAFMSVCKAVLTVCTSPSFRCIKMEARLCCFVSLKYVVVFSKIETELCFTKETLFLHPRMEIFRSYSIRQV